MREFLNRVRKFLRRWFGTFFLGERWVDIMTKEEFLAMDLTDAQYREIYGDDEAAIKRAKESWQKAGREVVAGRPKWFRSTREDY